jgi:glycosyltransferase involved in cell wall biosynthesis
MRIVQLAPLEEPVPPRKYGGTELVVYNLIEETVKMGHEVYLLGTGDSQVAGHLVPVIPKSLRVAYGPEEIDKWRDFLKIFHISTVMKLIREINPDIVHNHLSWRLIQFSEFIECPMYTTVHGPITALHERYTYEQNADAHYVSISNNQRKAMPDLNWVTTIYNGIDTSIFPFDNNTNREYFAFLGRTSPEKGLKEICAMIKETQYQLKIAAKVDSVDKQYFEEEIQPLIDDEQIVFLGEVDHDGKVELLQGAKALLLWLNWEEPFGLAVIEAMACGTPVIVNKRGSMPEIITHEESGFLVDSLDEMRERLADVSRIDPQACRDLVEKKFSAKVMAKEYLKLAGRLTV